jgi:hypothetical protein
MPPSPSVTAVAAHVGARRRGVQIKDRGDEPDPVCLAAE